MENYIQTHDDISFTLNGRRFVFDAKSFLNKIVSTQLGKHRDTFYYYRFKARFRYTNDKRFGDDQQMFGPMYVEILTNRLCKDLTGAIENIRRCAFVSWTNPTGWSTVKHWLYFDELDMFEQQKELSLNPSGVINELNKAIESKSIKVVKHQSGYMLGDFAAAIKDCTDEMNAVREFKSKDFTWYVITSRDKEDKTIHDVIKMVKANETFYDLHEVNEYISSDLSDVGTDADADTDVTIKGLY